MLIISSQQYSSYLLTQEVGINYKVYLMDLVQTLIVMYILLLIS